MSKVPQELIDEAARHGIVEGATIESAAGVDMRTVVSDPAIWRLLGDGNIDNGYVAGRSYSLYLRYDGQWAKVITPAPGAEPEGLKEGDAVGCGPAMRAAIVDLANEMGIPTYGVPPQDPSVMALVVHDYGRGPGPTTIMFGPKDSMPPEAFIAKMRATAKKPKPLRIGEWVVEFDKGSIKVGCKTIDNETVRAIAANLKD